jgi:hypothetical protein
MDPISPTSPPIQPISGTTAQHRGRGQVQQSVPGQLLKATVVEASGNNRFVLDFAGTKQQVRSEAALSVGQKLQLQVMTTSPAIELKIVTDTLNSFLGRSLTLLDTGVDLAALMRGLQQPGELARLTTASRDVLSTFFSIQQAGITGRDGGVNLKFMVENLGLNLENLLARGDAPQALATLKAALLNVADSLRDAGTIANLTGKLLATIELFQFAQLNSNADSISLFPLPLPFLELGYLSVERWEGEEGKGQSESTEQRFSLHLSLTELGNLRIDFVKNKEGLLLKFKAESEEIAEYIRAASSELEAALSKETGVTMFFSGGAPDPRLDLIHYLVPEGRSILDTTV